MHLFYRVFLFSLLVLAGNGLRAQLSPGDILFVGLMTDGNGQLDMDGFPDFNCGDAFAFAALVDIPANTTIYFTEDEWQGAAFEGNEETVQWSNAAVTPAGTVVNIITNAEVNSCAPISASVGTAQFAETTSDWALSSTNEEIYAYLGSPGAPTTWLTAILTDNSGGENTIPAELTGFVIDFTTVDQDVDLAVLNSTVNCGDKAACVAYITDLSNWQTEDEPGAGDCCNDMGVEYPDDLPPSLQACEQPVINGVEVVDCSNGPNGNVLLRVNGTLNGAERWEWSNPATSCVEAPTLVIGEEATGNFSGDIANSTFYVRAAGGCLTEPVCFSFVPAELYGAANFTAETTSFCATAAVQTGLSGGIPVGGTYSGPGVTDDGNGMTFSFDPAAAGIGAHTITYTVGSDPICGEGSTTVQFTVTESPLTVDLGPDLFPPTTSECYPLDPMPMGGSGDYSYFWPEVGFNTPTLTLCPFADGFIDLIVTDNVSGCRAIDTLNYSFPTSEDIAFDLSPQDTLCSDAGVQTGLGNATPAGGTYSGPGVTDDGNGMTFSFDPTVAGGAGTYEVIYTIGTGMDTSTLTVVTPMATLTLPDTLTTADAPLALTGGTPAGGTYTGTGVTDNGDGTFSFDPTAAGEGSFEIAYSVTDANGCSASATDTVTVVAPPVVTGDGCGEAIAIDSLLGAPFGEARTSGLFDNTDNTSTGDPTVGTECFFDETVDQTIWFSFTGDGNAYRIRSVVCDATNPMPNNDTQFALYRGSCGDLTPVACNEDENFDAEMLNAFLEVETEAGVNYFLMVDGYFGGEDEYDAIGEFCLEMTRFDPDFVGPADVCAEGVAIDSLFGAPLGEAQTSGLYDNTDNTSTGDPTAGTDCFADQSVDQTVWFSFTGDGGTYSLRSVVCDATDRIENNDTQFALYSGDCTDLSPVACNDDEDFNEGAFNAYLEVATEAGVEYHLMVDGYFGSPEIYDAIGQFCLEVTLLEPSSTVDLATAGLQVFPNPTTGLLQLDGFTADRTEIFDQLGRRVRTLTTPQTSYDLSELPSGVYYLRLMVDGQVYGTKVLKE